MDLKLLSQKEKKNPSGKTRWRVPTRIPFLWGLNLDGTGVESSVSCSQLSRRWWWVVRWSFFCFYLVSWSFFLFIMPAWTTTTPLLTYVGTTFFKLRRPFTVGVPSPICFLFFIYFFLLVYQFSQKFKRLGVEPKIY